MQPPSPDDAFDADLKDRVVAWHNKSLLTARIRADQVSGIGVVSLPFAAARPGGPRTGGGGRLGAWRARLGRLLSPALSTLARRLPQRAAPVPAPLFDEPFLPPLKPRVVARFARRFSDARRPGSTDWPVRKIAPKDGSAPRSRRYLRTAAIESGGRRIRVLIGSGDRPRIIGPRLWSRRRLSGLLAGFGLLVIGSLVPALWPLIGPSADAPAPVLASAANPAAASASAPVSASAPASAAAPVADGGASAASPAAPAASGADTVVAAADPAHPATPDAPSGTAPETPSNAASAPTRAASHSPAPVVATAADRPPGEHGPSAVAPGRSAESAAAAAATPDPRRGTHVTAASASSSASAPSETRFALAAEPTRSRVSSMLRLSLLDLPTEPQADGVHAELMQAGSVWRVVIWPYPNQEAARKAQGDLRQRGVKVELIAF